MSFDCTYVAITTFNFQILIPYFVNMINTMMMLQDGFFNVDTKYYHINNKVKHFTFLVFVYHVWLLVISISIKIVFPKSYFQILI